MSKIPFLQSSVKNTQANSGMDEDLYEKIKQILRAYDAEPGNILNDMFDKETSEIQQAFQDAGYIKVNQNFKSGYEGKSILSGQEWYDRYMENLKGRVFLYNDDSERDSIVYLINEMKEAARKAAGLEKQHGTTN